MIVPMMNRRFRGFLPMLFLTFDFSLLVETIQLVCKVGSFDVDDLLLNTVGGILGYLMFAVMDRLRRRRDEKTS